MPRHRPKSSSARPKNLLAVITMFFMVAYGVSQFVSGKIYDKIGTRRGFTLSAILLGGADALACWLRGSSR